MTDAQPGASRLISGVTARLPGDPFRWPERDGTERYSIGTWDTDDQAYTPQVNGGRWLNLTLWELRRAIRRLRQLGYKADRRGNDRDGHDDNDWMVLIERTEGKSEAEVMEDWKR